MPWQPGIELWMLTRFCRLFFDSDDLLEARVKDEFSFNNGSKYSNIMPSACIVDGNQNQSRVLQPNSFFSYSTSTAAVVAVGVSRVG